MSEKTPGLPDGTKKNISANLVKLDQTEFWVVAGVVCSAMALVFSFGILLGLGLGQKSPHAVEIVSSEESAHHGDEGHRAPASTKMTHGSEKANILPGAKLRESFREAKQQALEDLLKSAEQTEPTSLTDAKTYVENERVPQNLDRAPASAKPVNEEESVQIPQSSRVSRLFERSPASLNDFSPTYGDFTVIIGSFPTQDEAEVKLRRLRESGQNEAYFKKIQSKSGENWYRVGVGSFPSAKEAERIRSVLIKRKLALSAEVQKATDHN